jgi:hypothetical protein
MLKLLPNSKCDCNKSCPPIDINGLHFATGCNKDGGRIRQHDAMVRAINETLKADGLLTVVEERGCFNKENLTTKSRPDISVFNFPGNAGKKLILDITITNPIPLGLTTKLKNVEQSKAKNRSGQKASHLKNEMYKKKENSADYAVLPIVFESTGSGYSKTVSFLKKIIKQKENIKAKPIEGMQRYWLTYLMVTLQKYVAMNINERVLNVYKNIGNIDYTSSKFEVADYPVIN